MDQIILSVLTPAVPSRMAQLGLLQEILASQIDDKAVEHLVLIDNKRRSVGAKRDALLRAARGRYVAFVDDDDQVCPGYIFEILKATETDPDVITFRQEAFVDGLKGEIEFGLGNINEPFKPNGVAKRNAWHVCAWKRQWAVLSSYPDINYGEDWAYASKLCALPGLRSVHIPKVLHRYIHSAATTEAPFLT